MERCGVGSAGCEGRLGGRVGSTCKGIACACATRRGLTSQLRGGGEHMGGVRVTLSTFSSYKFFTDVVAGGDTLT